MIGIGIAVSGEKSFPSLLDVWFKLKSNFDTKKERPVYSCIEVEDSSKPLIMGRTPETGGVQGDCDHQKSENHSNLLEGVLCAILVGALNGSFMIPLKYANKDVVASRIPGVLWNRGYDNDTGAFLGFMLLFYPSIKDPYLLCMSLEQQAQPFLQASFGVWETFS
ncbi:hypothetical protein KI387_024717, partial [Taxus chinensis]